MPATHFGRGDRIRTCDLLVPNQALYQAKLHPERPRVNGCAPAVSVNGRLGAVPRFCFRPTARRQPTRSRALGVFGPAPLCATDFESIAIAHIDAAAGPMPVAFVGDDVGKDGYLADRRARLVVASLRHAEAQPSFSERSATGQRPVTHPPAAPSSAGSLGRGRIRLGQRRASGHCHGIGRIPSLVSVGGLLDNRTHSLLA
jgi:hypothetical protein